MTSLSQYLARGWRIFPCHSIESGWCSCKQADCPSPGKHPRTAHGVNDASTDPEVVRSWWTRWPTANWAVACGADSGLVVVDIDERKGGYDEFDRWVDESLADGVPETLRANTGGGGQHLFFRYPSDGTVKNRVNWLPGVDVRAEGGYVVLPPSNHVSGGSYSWRSDFATDPAELPPQLLSAMSGGASGGLGATPLADTDTLLSGVPEGSRDDTIFRLACRWRRQLGDNRQAVTVLVLEAARQCDPPFSEREALVKVDQAFKQDHEDDDLLELTGSSDPLYALTDMGNRDRFVRAYSGKYRFVTGWGWLVWTDLGWVETAEDKVTWDANAVPAMVRDEVDRVPDVNTQNQYRRWAKESQGAGRIANTLKLARGHPQVAAEPDQFDSEPTLIACRNGMVDLRDGSIRPFRADDLFTKNTGVVYEPGFRLPEWDRFLRSATRDDDALVEYMQLAAGYTLTGLVSEECFFIISGPTGTGKSTFVEGMTGAMGQYCGVANAETFMRRANRDPDREEVAKFPGARMISTSELPEGERFNDAFLKRITGGDTLTARRLYQESFTFTPQFKLWMATNFDPVTSDSAMFRRIKRLPFEHAIPAAKRDRNLKRIIKDPELGGKAVLAWAVEGAQRYLDAGRLVTPNTVALSTGEYQQEQDVFTQFLQEVFVRDPEAKMKLSEVHGRHSMWAKDNNDRALRRPQVVQKLRDAGVIVTASSNENRDRQTVGIRLRDGVSVGYS